MPTKEKSKFHALSELLKELNLQGNFGASVIASEEGLIMAENILNSLSREVLAAVSALVYAMGQRIQDYLKLKSFASIRFDSPYGAVFFRPVVIQKVDKKLNLILTVIGENVEKRRPFWKRAPSTERLLSRAQQSITQIFKESK